MLIISQKFDFGNRDMENILDNLNKEQREAVETVRGPLLVLAGAGSGKTKLLTSRIAYLIQNGVRPRNILAVTFTNKAAKEMKERLGNILGENVVKYMWVGTFHGICGRILRENIENYSFQSGKRLDKNFSIYDETDSNAVIKQAIKKLNLDDKVYAPKLVKTVISNAKNKMQWYWDEGFKGIKYANIVLSRIDAGTYKDEAERNAVLGTAYFQRAYRYYKLTHQFGNVPFLDREYTEPKLDFYSHDRWSILEQLKKDLEFAYEWVPEKVLSNTG